MVKLSIKPSPDFSRLDTVLRRKGIPDRVPFYELFSNIENDVLAVLGNPAVPADVRLDRHARQDQILLPHITYQYQLGYDYMNIREDMTGFLFEREKRHGTDTKQGVREYMTQGESTITDREDFDKYVWPVMSGIDYSYFERASEIIPEGMKIIGDSPGIFENIFWLLGFESLSYMLYEDPELLGEIFEETGKRVCEYFDTIASCDKVGAVRYGDDMGYKTQTLLPPDVYRKYLFPWHRKIVDIAHKYNKPIILHSCGNLESIMEDIIETGWDAKHSFEDVIEPIWTAKEKYGSRIALLGGFDLVKLGMMNPEEVREHTRLLIDKCAPGGGWALGSGNSIPNYIPIENLLAMLDEGYIYGQ